VRDMEGEGDRYRIGELARLSGLSFGTPLLRLRWACRLDAAAAASGQVPIAAPDGQFGRVEVL
jgi:hypothetical protein